MRLRARLAAQARYLTEHPLIGEHGEIYGTYPNRPWKGGCIVGYAPWVVAPHVHQEWVDQMAYLDALSAWCPTAR